MLYISRKKSVGEHTGNQHTDSELCQSGTIPSTAEAVAKETGVSPRTIANDAAYAEACDKARHQHRPVDTIGFV
jgi:hypothetical protein